MIAADVVRVCPRVKAVGRDGATVTICELRSHTLGVLRAAIAILISRRDGSYRAGTHSRSRIQDAYLAIVFSNGWRRGYNGASV